VNNLVRLNDKLWPDFIKRGAVVVVFTRSDCSSCTDIHSNLDTIFSKSKVSIESSNEDETSNTDQNFDSNNYSGLNKVNGVAVYFGEARLDEPGLGAVKRQEKWILTEVDILPFWALFKDGTRRSVHRGANSERLSRWLQEALD